MVPDLTVDKLCDAIRHFFQEIAASDKPVDREKGITFWGTPADDTMKTIMEQFGGKLKMTVIELPADLQFLSVESMDQESGLNLWRPGRVAGCFTADVGGVLADGGQPSDERISTAAEECSRAGGGS